ncbi:hypothetical protein CQW23_28488 [Capsicum baccatum]|uniref:Uncharacterized protein n=1 Tax=Capsicum baccatum TaxID=33114 RepID=A0A2G2VGN6_CAPBA|nr:hypothetical protein CQW23_28488 [Capsicum baccatum]
MTLHIHQVTLLKFYYKERPIKEAEKQEEEDLKEKDAFEELKKLAAASKDEFSWVEEENTLKRPTEVADAVKH